MYTKISVLLSLLFAVMFLTGCASIVDGRAKHVKINTRPPGATVTIYDKTGKEVLVTNTPANVKLRRRHGFLTFEDYRVVVQAEGYYPFETHVKSSINPWYVGNIIFGGLVGLVIVDPATGAIFTISPRKIDENLVSSAVPLTPEELKQAQLKLNPPLTNSPPVSLAPRIHRQ